MADWFAQLNNKMGGDLKKIQTVGEYFVEVWKAVGMEDIGEKVNLPALAPRVRLWDLDVSLTAA